MQTDCQSPSLPRQDGPMFHKEGIVFDTTYTPKTPPPADFVEIAVCAMRAFKDELERQKQYALRSHDISAISAMPSIATLPARSGVMQQWAARFRAFA
ncbi:MAG: hypothetical protein IPH35_09895 [Rhodoferax sp.]|nr:hypothetical protein [Rhodoferax sp.]